MELNLITSVNLNNENSAEIGQSIYSSQLYGTFFMIYGVFDASFEENTNTYEINSIHLKIMNYKGIVNLAITKAFIITHVDEDGTEEYRLKVEVQAKLGSDENSSELFLVEDSKNLKIQKENKIILERYLKPIHQINDEKDFPALKNGVFDEEFFYREGDFDKNTNKKTQFVAKTIKQISDISENAPAMALSGRACPFSFLFFFW